ncbi:hypothetical protein H671_1g4322 [Cricetulus griseus]|nr:hypothetical protein H671_1g4322 [Cricetulus griseus]
METDPCGEQIIRSYFNTLIAFLQQQGNYPSWLAPLDYSSNSRHHTLKSKEVIVHPTEGSNSHSQAKASSWNCEQGCYQEDAYFTAMPHQVVLSHKRQTNGCCCMTPQSHSEWTTQVFFW